MKDDFDLRRFIWYSMIICVLVIMGTYGILDSVWG